MQKEENDKQTQNKLKTTGVDGAARTNGKQEDHIFCGHKVQPAGNLFVCKYWSNIFYTLTGAQFAWLIIQVWGHAFICMNMFRG